jgi:DNA polymerase-3 subunit alpha
MTFIHLRTHSPYSLAEGALRYKTLLSLCRSYSMPAVAVTDTNNLFGALEFALEAIKSGVQPIIGAEVTVHLPIKTKALMGSGQAHLSAKLVLLAQDRTGYQNLMTLMSAAYLTSSNEETTDPFVLWDHIITHHTGLVALTGGPEGSVGQLLLTQNEAAAEDHLKDLKHLFGDRLYIEIMRHDTGPENKTEPTFLRLAHAYDIPLVATNNAHFEDQSFYEAHDALMCIAQGVTLNHTDRRQLNDQYFFKSPEQMINLFADLPEAIENTLVIAQRCAYAPEEHAPVLPPFSEDENEELMAQAKIGLMGRLSEIPWLPTDPDEKATAIKTYEDRLDFEVGVIGKMGYAGYFLIVADFIKWAKTQDIPVGPGRGSGAGSVVAWCLTITDLDPLHFGLLFERFLNPDRVSMPDFDVDFCQDRRDEVISYVQQRYGADRVAQIITFGKLQARAAVRDVGRVLSVPYPVVDRVCKLIPSNPAAPVTLSEALKIEPALREEAEKEESVAHVLEVAQKLEGLYRHASTHAAGLVIGDRPLEQMIPLYKDPKSAIPVTQFNMKLVEKAGLVKFDFLGLRTLTVMAETNRLIKRDGGVPVKLEKIPLDDDKTFQMLRRCETMGVFQLESAGMRDVLQKMQPTCFEELIALISLFRPGPMENIPKYIAYKHGKEKIQYMHPKLEGILKETFGIMIYQEQVMQAAQILAGYSLSEADLLRRAMGKKIKSEMDAQRETFVSRAHAEGINKKQATSIFDQIDKFAGYGFNKSHAAAYALILYQTAYLKAHYPVHFMAATMTYDMNNTDKLGVICQEIKRMGVTILPPCVNHSDSRFSVETQADGTKGIRYALAAVKSVGEGPTQAITQERDQQGPYTSLADLMTRTGQGVFNKRLLEKLIAAGALDNLHDNRGELWESRENLLKLTQSGNRDTNQSSFFDQMDMPAVTLDLTTAPDWAPLHRLNQERDAIGFFLTRHPLSLYADILSHKKALSSGSLANQREGIFTLAGVVVDKRIRIGKRGAYAFLQMTDEDGAYELTVFSDVLETCRDLLDTHKPLEVLVSIQDDKEGNQRLTAQKIQILGEDHAYQQISLHIDPVPEAFRMLQQILSEDGAGDVRVVVSFVLPQNKGTTPKPAEDLGGASVTIDNHTVSLTLPQTYALGSHTQIALKNSPFIQNIQHKTKE